MPFLRRIDAALLVGSGAIAGIAFHRVFDPGAVIEVVVWSVLAAAVVSVAAQRLQLGLATGVLLHAACFVVTGSAVLFRHDRLAGVIPNLHAMGLVWHGMIDGWADVLAVPAPSRGAPTDLVIVALVAWFACAGALELRWRTTSLTAPLAPPVIAFGVALPFAVGGPGTNGPLAIALAVSALGFIAARKTGLRPSEETADNETQPVERRSPGRSVARATVFLSALTVAIGSLVVALPVSATAYNPRADRRDPVRPAAEVNPLSSIRRLLTDDRDTELFVVTSDHPIPTDSYWRLATLDRYDDDMWQPGPDPFGPTGSRLTKPTGSSASRARYTFVIRGLTGELLPVPPAVSTVEQASLRYQQTGQTLLDPRGVSASESYAVTADPAPTVTADALANAVIPATMPTNANRDPSHACIEALAAALSAGKTQPSEQLSAFQSFLQDPTLFTDNPAAAHSGHGLSELIDLVRPAIAHVGSTSPALNNDCAVAGPTDVPVPVAGTVEQFASIFALLARAEAIPARVVVGFGIGRATAPNTVTVSGGDANVWAEIPTASGDWVRVLIQPHEGSAPRPATLDIPSASTAHPTGGGEDGPGPPAIPPVPSRYQMHHNGHSWLLVAGVTAVPVLLMIGAASIVVLKRRRSWRRRRGGRRQHVLGRWHDGIDRLVERGASITGAMSPSEVATISRSRFGEHAGAAVAKLGLIASAAAFRSGEPQADQREQADVLYSQLVAALGERTGVARRLRACFSIKPLLPGAIDAASGPGRGRARWAAASQSGGSR